MPYFELNNLPIYPCKFLRHLSLNRVKIFQTSLETGIQSNSKYIAVQLTTRTISITPDESETNPVHIYRAFDAHLRKKERVLFIGVAISLILSAN